MTKRVRVLVADDHEAVRKGIGAFLEETMQFRLVGEASHGQECVELAERLRPDVVIMDITMPGIDGIKATKRLVSLVKGIRIVAHTCHDDTQHVLEMLDAGACAYVCKDDGWPALARAIDMGMDDKVYVSPGIKGMTSETADAAPVRILVGPRHLTPRQLEVLRLLAKGHTNKGIAAKLRISVSTVERHRENIRTRTGLKTVAQLSRFAAELGLA